MSRILQGYVFGVGMFIKDSLDFFMSSLRSNPATCEGVSDCVMMGILWSVLPRRLEIALIFFSIARA